MTLITILSVITYLNEITAFDSHLCHRLSWV